MGARPDIEIGADGVTYNRTSPNIPVAQPVGLSPTGVWIQVAPEPDPFLAGPPSNIATSGVPLDDQPEIWARIGVTIDTSYAGDVFVSVFSSDSGTASIDDGQTFASATDGVATFTNLIITADSFDSVVLAFTLENGHSVNSDAISIL
jgi:hypothetical protein